MVIIKINGGLGNQMFQYAYAYALALRTGCSILFDCEEYKGKNIHQGMELERIFDIGLDFSSKKQVVELLGFRNKALVRSILSRWPFTLVSWPYKRQYLDVFKREYLCVPDGTYVEGYFQSENFFQDFKNEIKEKFKWDDQIKPECLSFLKLINSSNSVSIHIRRGDYLDPKVAKFHGVLGFSYYKKAIELIEGNVDNPNFFVFSDDLDWARELFSSYDGFFFVDSNSGRDSHLDMFLMSQCKHNIIANSSFSWWGAWLAETNEQMVIAPRHWIASNRFSVSNIYPNNWTIID
ncbi:alpha-1,2-fucosyltransferase [Iodobacter sp. CM08]|uniref:alpha-1,2-fucosyltransferase n=1 Tax=Iodobacter sp. CM08 TaxID=3085902 RepID=UPI002981D214|nr:alpha-1,2-fucosyltransferase [Iodobacter sp. CM08]MDW5416970.1 alpha-1,2-fucosyltransferase [Iodobacter sp. CM08]